MAVSEGSRRVTITLPIDQVVQLDAVASKLRVTRSGLLSTLVGSSLESLVYLASCLPDDPDNPSEGEIKRMRGASAEIIGQQVTRLMGGGMDDLFKS